MTIRELPTQSPGKQRGLQQCVADNDTFCILALDHRRVVQQAFDTYPQAVDFKRQVLTALSPFITAVLLDPTLGAGPLIADHTLPGKLGLLVSVEKSGYEGPDTARVSRLPEHWNVAAIKRMGASAVKLLVYYHPDAPTALAMRELVRQVSAECQQHDLTLFLEPMSYSLNAQEKKPLGSERQRVVIQSARELCACGGDVLKAEFPFDSGWSNHVPDWEKACRELSEAAQIPWVLLSAGQPYEEFLEQAEIACRAGASGVLAGRSIWKEALNLPDNDRRQFLESTARVRMQALKSVCSRFARPYTVFYPPTSVSAEWAEDYAVAQV